MGQVKECQYKVIYVDLTTRCNMNCNFCYMNGIKSEDVDLSYFEEVCKDLPHKVIFRFLGGEPTIHPQFLDFMEVARKYRHLPTVASNGKMYLDDSFVKEMKRIGGIYGITLNGGLTNRDVYKTIDNEDCLDWKVKALHNLIEHKIRGITLSCIILRGVSEGTIGELVKFAEDNRKYVKFLKLRSAAKLGRHIDIEPYTTEEFKRVVFPNYFDVDKCRTVYTTKEEDLIEICAERQCCYYFSHDGFLTVSFVEFCSENARKCWKRGGLKKDHEVVDFFEEMNANASIKEISI